MCNWVRQFGREAIASGLLVFKTGLGMKYWHASIGKNTAHRVAMEIDWDNKGAGCAAPLHLALVNLDNDNLPGPTFVEVVASEAMTSLGDPMCLWFHKKGGEQGGTLGQNFCHINGYHEDLEGVGFQDIDIVNRIAVVQQGQWGNLKYTRRVNNAVAIGHAIPNHPQKSYAVGTYKLLYTDKAATLSTHLAK